MTIISSWERLPVVVRATASGIAVALAGIIPWSTFAGLNLKYWPAVPWAILPSTIWLWFYSCWLRGEGWPRSTSNARRESLRANAPPTDVFGLAIFAGLIGFAALMPFTILLNRLVTLNQAKPFDVPPTMPVLTTFLLLVMASIVAGVAEEAGFRGYLQGPIERRHGVTIAIVITGLLFGLAHFRHHPGLATLGMLPFYLFVAAVYGLMAYGSNSILPGMVVHAGGDVFVLVRWWLTGQGEWQLTAAPPSLIWDTGPDAAFWGALAAFIILAAFAVFVFSGLLRARRA
jgi:membrane protease YdiL (CAAX protease family)